MVVDYQDLNDQTNRLEDAGFRDATVTSAGNTAVIDFKYPHGDMPMGVMGATFPSAVVIDALHEVAEFELRPFDLAASDFEETDAREAATEIAGQFGYFDDVRVKVETEDAGGFDVYRPHIGYRDVRMDHEIVAEAHGEIPDSWRPHDVFHAYQSIAEGNSGPEPDTLSGFFDDVIETANVSPDRP